MRSNSLYMWQLVSCNICLLLTITSSIFSFFFLQYITPEEKLGQQHSRSNIMHIWDISPHHQNFAYQLMFLVPGRQHYCLERNSWIQILRIYWHKLEQNPKYSYNNPSLLSKVPKIFFPFFFEGSRSLRLITCVLEPLPCYFSPLHSAAASAADIFESKWAMNCWLTCLATDIISKMTLGSSPAPPLLVSPHTWPFLLTDTDTAELIWDSSSEVASTM